MWFVTNVKIARTQQKWQQNAPEEVCEREASVDFIYLCIYLYTLNALVGSAHNLWGKNQYEKVLYALNGVLFNSLTVHTFAKGSSPPHTKYFCVKRGENV